MHRKERRKPSQDNANTAGDRTTKQLIILTICLIAATVVYTICKLSLRETPIPDQLDRLATLLVGGLLGSLVKTGVDSLKPSEPMEIKAPDGEPLETTDVTEEPKE